MPFNENSRVKIPAILHLMRLGYEYIPGNKQDRDPETNIFSELFVSSILRINPSAEIEEVKKLLEEIRIELDFEDLGKKFYERLVSTSGIKLIDFQDFNNNSFHVTTELTYKNGDEEFRPDITILINGMPLSFIEVKKPHNKEGVIQERNRINDRFKRTVFRRFVNITQFMIFSNNMEYEDGVIEPIFGAFYASAAYSDLKFNYFREDEDYPVKEKLKVIDEKEEFAVLRDNNLTVIKNSPEFITNKNPNSPTNRILTSMFSRERLAFILRYGLAYVDEENAVGLPNRQKHIMRYPQMFATMAIAAKLDKGQDKGIIWHTQGSGKTALAFYNVKFLTDYYQKRNTIPKFYFIVDRLDLLIQAQNEFSNRGLKVKTVNSRKDFAKELKVVSALHNEEGKPEITVINIQKFSEDATVIDELKYDINTQKVYFLDEAHRSYNPKGSYLANLINSDRNAVKIALTGTPLLRDVAKEYDSKMLFGDYIHKYYYNRSIADGYTLRLIREEIEGTYKAQMQKVMDEIKILKGEIKTGDIFANPNFVSGLLDYITGDLFEFRKKWRDNSLGAMVVCDSSAQARELFKQFEEKYGEQEVDAEKLYLAADQRDPNDFKKKEELSGALILHDENDKQIRKGLVNAFKKGKIDVLFVYNMLLTGFDAHRLKKLYLARVIQDHNLLQTLTRVNRPYKNYNYGYVVDFADISQAFERTNRLYFQELQEQLGDDLEFYQNIFKSEEEIKQELEEIKDTLFIFNTDNKEIFSQQIAEIHNIKELKKLIQSLIGAKELKSLITINGYDIPDALNDINLWNELLKIVQSRLDNLNFLESIEKGDETKKLLDTALENIIFEFVKIGEEELKLVDEYKDQLRRTREGLGNNFDQSDPEFVKLYDELKRLLEKKNLNEMDQKIMLENMFLLKKIEKQAKEINRKNELLKAKYENDEKYARIQKRLTEKGDLTIKEAKLHKALMGVKNEIDNRLERQEDLIKNEAFFKRSVLQAVSQNFIEKEKIKLSYDSLENINLLISREYFRQYNPQY